ncbi:MAG: hypothetical protein R3A52_12580 [Polyangiales bacterium]
MQHPDRDESWLALLAEHRALARRDRAWPLGGRDRERFVALTDLILAAKCPIDRDFVAVTART